MPKNFVLLSELSEKPPGEFAIAAYEAIMGRPPTPRESDDVVAAMLRGDSPTWILGALRYGAEGSRHGAEIPGLRVRYLAQRTWRIPAIGPILQWFASLLRLPASLRYFRAVRQHDALTQEQARRSLATNIDDLARRCEEMVAARTNDAALLAKLEATIRESLASIDALHQEHAGARAQLDDLRARYDDVRQRAESVTASIAELRAAFDNAQRHQETIRDSLAALRSEFADETGRLASDRARFADVVQGVTDRSGAVESEIQGVTRQIEDLRRQHDGIAASLAQMHPRLESLFPKSLAEKLEVDGSPLAPLARERRGLPPGTAIPSLSPHERYALFESVFYESVAVAEKQRIYLGVLNRPLSQRFPFLDLGCGRGEFLRILRDDGIEAIGVDINPASLATARADGLRVFEQDLLAFLESDRGIYSGASLLQVAEHLTSAQLDRLLELVMPRLAPGAVFILETPNPLSPFALGVFYTDATHVVPLPPERMRFALETAGFENTRTLFQGRIPGNQFAGPDPRAWYMDYAIIASRGTS
jgi:SAM-dependent methyltransferase/predicted  nucleic acid-binding Zn-ribbon protein